MFKDYNELVDPLVLPINGKAYTLPAVGITDGIRLTEAFDPESETVLDNTELNRIILGATYDEMLADNVPGIAVVRATLTGLADFQRGRAVAEVMWETGGDPKAMAAWVEATSNRASRRSTSTGAAGSTKPRSSTSGTRKSPPK